MSGTKKRSTHLFPRQKDLRSVAKRSPALNPKVRLTRDEYCECFRSALRRMAVALNCLNRLCPGRWLNLNDADITTKLVERSDGDAHKSLDDLLVSLHREQQDQNVTDEDAAENF